MTYIAAKNSSDRVAKVIYQSKKSSRGAAVNYTQIGLNFQFHRKN